MPQYTCCKLVPKYLRRQRSFGTSFWGGFALRFDSTIDLSMGNEEDSLGARTVPIRTDNFRDVGLLTHPDL